MSRRCWNLFSIMLFLAYANCASADSDPGPRAVANVSAKEFDQIVYKGLVGNVLDGIPMDPSRRVNLQRTNAVLSNTLSGRSLAVLLGLSNPVLLLGGFVWGVWAASNIKPEADGMNAISDASQSGAEIAAQEGPVALSVEPSRLRPPVVKVWLPQRPSMMAVAQ